MLENIARFNTERGGLTPSASNILYVHGQYDPWRSIGVQSLSHPDSPVIVINGKLFAEQSNESVNPVTVIIFLRCISG